MKHKILLFFLFLTTFLSAQEVYNYREWTYAGASIGDDEYYVRSIDGKKPVKQFNKISIWVKKIGNISYINASNKEVFLKDGKTVVKYIYDCKEYKSKILSMYHYNSKSEIVSSIDETELNDDWYSVLPDSVGEGLLEFSCNEY